MNFITPTDGKALNAFARVRRFFKKRVMKALHLTADTFVLYSRLKLILKTIG